MMESLQRYPKWKLNLEIEPETWDVARRDTPQDYAEFQALAADQSANGRIEFVNPAYGQAYLWNISGESVIQQFDRGFAKLREHFPKARVTTYCSEEPCFTSALPGILKSFGFERAVLKNPNTCWGGYTRAFGGELVNWIGPDGTGIVTVPRYESESLIPERTWETIANANSTDYIRAALDAGIKHPVGMCLQDAGWRFGPWLKDKKSTYQPTEYTTWRNYFERVATNAPAADWHLSQEDIQVSLVWGAQVLQRIAQQVRIAENRLVMAEKLASMASAFEGATWPAQEFDEAWRTLLLAQHHDCWIVPYNGRKNDTWADKVARWTTHTRETADNIINRATLQLTTPGTNKSLVPVVVFNTQATARHELVSVPVPAEWRNAPLRAIDSQGSELPAQLTGEDSSHLVFRAAAPAIGFETYRLESGKRSETKGISAVVDNHGLVRVESDLYRLEVDPKQGGIIRSWIAKGLGERELVNKQAERKLNELRGYFFDQKRFCSTTDQPATVEIAENGPVRVRLKINSTVASNPVTQWITVVQGEPRVDFNVKIDWQGNPRIGSAFEQENGFRREHNHKAFYEDEFKLLAHFPFKLQHQQITKDAPFDITQSHLTDTRFNSWSDIKNNVILHWIDVFDPDDKLGVALLTDHTGNYVHGPDFPLSLTLQYAGVGLWGRDYTVRGPTEVSYGLLPHAGNAVAADIWRQGNAWCEPLLVQSTRTPATELSDLPGKSLLTFDRPGWEVPTIRSSPSNTLVRLFNASADATGCTIRYGAAVSRVELVELDGRMIKGIDLHRNRDGTISFKLALPRFSVATLRLTP
ncbi:MAG: glycoside hydrolase family 38 C-terminal domain-containing protein [Verrucomicrobiota bacterium]